MTRIATTARRLEHASDLASLLDAAYEAFKETMTAIREHEDSTGIFFAGFAYAAAAAADGRDAIAAAPALPRTSLSKPSTDGPPDPGQDTEALAAALTALSEVLAARLAQAAESVAGPGDRTACRLGARQAQEICALLAGP